MSPDDRDTRPRDDDELSDDALEAVTGGAGNTVGLGGTSTLGLGLGGTVTTQSQLDRGAPLGGTTLGGTTLGGDVAID